MPPKTVPINDFNLYLLEALKDPQIKSEINKLIDRESLMNEIDIESTALVQSLRRDLKGAHDNLKRVQAELADCQTKIDDQEQYSRKNNLRFNGIPETDDENTHELILETCNNVLELEDPITLADISNSHRLPAPRNADASAPRPMIVKFTNTRARRRVFSARRCLKEVNEAMKYRRPIAPGTANDDDDDEPFQSITLSRKIYMNEDLSGARLKLAFEARQLKRAGNILDTWVIDGKIKIKDSHSVIATVGSLKDLVKYGYVPPQSTPQNGQINSGTASTSPPGPR